MQYCCFLTSPLKMYPSMFYRFTSHGRDEKTCKIKVVYSKVKKNCIFSQKTRFGFKSHNGVLCLHTEVTNWAPYSSHMYQMKLRYTGYIYRNTRTSCSIHKRSHISIFVLVVSYSAEDQIFTTENFPWNMFCFVHAIKRTQNSGLESL